MPFYKAELRFAHDATWPNRRKWSNVFYLNAASSTAAAAALVANWISNLAGAVRTSVFAYEVYASDLLPGTDDFTVQAIPSGDQRGNLAVPAGGEPYLLKTALGVRLTVSNSRPSLKYFRPGLYEEDITDGVAVNGVLLGQITTAFNAFLGAGGGTLWRDPDDQILEDVGRITLTTREFGRYAGNDVPLSPPVG